MPQNKTLFFWAIAASIALWLLSFIAFVHPVLQPIILSAMLVGFTLLAFRSFPAALLVFFFELIIGNKGSLFSIAISDNAFGFRLILFSIVMLAWFVQALRQHQLFAFRKTPYIYVWPIFLAVIAYGVVYGILRDPSNLVYFDANGYIFYLALLPLSLVYLKSWWWQVLKPVFLGATTALALFTIICSLGFTFFFPSGSATEATDITQEQILALSGDAEGEGILAQTTTLGAGKIVLEEQEAQGIAVLYRWMRDTGNGEVSFIGNAFFRVFAVSQIYLFITFFWLLHRVMQGNPFARNAWGGTALLVLHALAMAVSFSRSLWLGAAVGVILFCALLPSRLRLRVIAAFTIGIVLIVLLAVFVFPSIGDVFWERLVSLFAPSKELAASTRLSLLEPIIDRIQERPFLGWGFGTTVSYLAPIPGTDAVETIRVYLFEWAYLDLIVKVGLIGFAGFLAFLATGFRTVLRVWRRERSEDSIAASAALAFLATAHLTTPYLNHPLGIGLLLLLSMYAAARNTTYAAS